MTKATQSRKRPRPVYPKPSAADETNRLLSEVCDLLQEQLEERRRLAALLEEGGWWMGGELRYPRRFG